MTRYTLSFANSLSHKAEHPERTATRQAGSGLNFDIIYQVWPNRPSMAKSIRMQQRREKRAGDWSPIVNLSDGEGY